MKKISTLILGVAGMIGAPWLFIDFVENGLYEHFVPNTASGIRNFLFMTGWLCSVLALYRIHADRKKGVRWIILIQLALLLLADFWCVHQIIRPSTDSIIARTLDVFWPIGGFFMVITGIVICFDRKLKGWKLYTPLLAGIWFPLNMSGVWFSQVTINNLVLSGVYATICFTLLGATIVAYALEAREQPAPRKRASKNFPGISSPE